MCKVEWWPRMFLYDWSLSRLVAIWQGMYWVLHCSLAENGPCLVNEDGDSTYLNPYR